jgi:hypothetical protein
MQRIPAAALIVASVVSCGVISGCNVRSGEARPPSAEGVATLAAAPPFQDSIRLARRYAALSTNIADLKLEMWSRTTGAVLREFRWTPPTGPGSFGAQPVTRDYPLPARRSVSAALDRSPRASARRRRTRVAFATVRPSFEHWARSGGFRIDRNAAASDTPNTIVFGDSVALDDVKAVAMQLYNTGTPTRSIRFFAAGEGDPRTIRIRYNQFYDGVPPLSLEQIRSLRLPRPEER